MSKSRSRLLDIDALRAIAALSVLYFHATNTVATYPSNTAIRTSGKYGFTGVDIFFVISGFILPYVMFLSGFKLSIHWKTFLFKRIMRIEPAYIASILVTVGLGLIVNWMYHKTVYSYSLPQLLSHLLYLNSFMGFEWVNPVYWSLAIEFQFYLVLMLIYPALMSKYGRFALLIPLSLLSMNFSNSATILHFFPLFLIGISTFLYFTESITLAWYFGFLALAAVTGMQTLGRIDVIAGLVTGISILAFRHIQINWRKQLLFCGSISYSIYLIHYPVVEKTIRIGQHFGQSLIIQLSVLVCSLSIALLLSYLFFLLVEKPSQELASSVKYSPK
jgi:peptidoglycan/LPS O-acetylase OafA/YrhL